jgi:hypothetical protein|tara:strand:+ start:63 stop:587 length:525 start_codon:yes stop_codon:yes gene_type:complete
MFKNIRDLLGRISEKSGNIARVFEDILGGLKELSTEVEPLQIDPGGFERQIGGGRKRSLIKDLDSAIKSVVEGIEEINLIPGEPGDCYPLCICKAFGKWNSRKYGFKGIAEKTISYWQSCSEINEITLIITFAWDELDFNQIFRKQFDYQTSDPDKTVCVILATSQGFSIQYLK